MRNKRTRWRAIDGSNDPEYEVDFIKRIEVHEVKNVLVEYSDHLDENGHVSVTAWANGEGFDVEVHGGDHGSSGMIGLTHTQWEALQRAMNRLQLEENGSSKK